MSLPSRRREVLSLVERGWRGARECSLTLNAMAIPVTHLIKGRLTREVQAMIQPYPGVRIISVPRLAFRLWLWGILLWGTVGGQLHWLLVDHERTLHEVGWWCRAFGFTLVTIRQTDQGYTLHRGAEECSLASVFGLDKADALSTRVR